MILAAALLLSVATPRADAPDAITLAAVDCEWGCARYRLTLYADGSAEWRGEYGVTAGARAFRLPDGAWGRVSVALAAARASGFTCEQFRTDQTVYRLGWHAPAGTVSLRLNRGCMDAGNAAWWAVFDAAWAAIPEFRQLAANSSGHW